MQTEAMDSNAVPSWKEELFDWVESIVISVVVVVLIFTFLLRPVTVIGHSMEPTLHGDDRLIVMSINYTPTLGDIVVLDSDGLGKPLVKRILGVPGDTIDIDFDAHLVYVNGTALEEEYINEPTTEQGDVEFPVVVPEGHVFVMGDNRNHSTDSRWSDVGMVPRDKLVGKAVFRIFPFSKLGFVN